MLFILFCVCLFLLLVLIITDIIPNNLWFEPDFNLKRFILKRFSIKEKETYKLLGGSVVVGMPSL